MSVRFVLAALRSIAAESGPEELAELSPLVARAAWFVLGFAIVTAVGWLLVEPLVARVVRRRNRNNPTIQAAISQYVRLLSVLVAAVVGVSVAGYGQFLSDSALVVAAGTLAVGVAAQTVIGSLVSGLVLVFDPEFSVGDRIEFGDYEGAVKSIQLRATRLETANGELVTVPNTALTGEVVVRPYGRGQYRLVDRVAVDYGEDLGEAVSQVAAAAGGLDAVLDDPPPRAYVEELGDDAVVLRAHYWIPQPGPEAVLDVRSQYAQAVQAALAAANITVSPAQEHELSGRVVVGDERDR